MLEPGRHSNGFTVAVKLTTSSNWRLEQPFSVGDLHEEWYLISMVDVELSVMRTASTIFCVKKKIRLLNSNAAVNKDY